MSKVKSFLTSKKIMKVSGILLSAIFIISLVMFFTRSYSLSDIPSGVTITVPENVLVHKSSWDSYTGDGLIYDWDNFKITVSNSTDNEMTNLAINVLDTEDVTDSNGVTKNLYHSSYDSTLSKGSTTEAKFYGVYSKALNYQNPTGTVQISFTLDGNDYVKDYSINFNHVVKELSSLPLVESSEQNYSVTYKNNENQPFLIKINKSKIYMDISEDLYDQDVEFSYYSVFGLDQGSKYNIQVYAPQSANSAKTVYSNELTPRLSNYFTYDTYDNILTFTADSNYHSASDHRLWGSPNKTLTDGLTDVYVPIYAVYHKDHDNNVFNRNGYDKNTYQEDNFTGADQVKLQVSITDKSKLLERILYVENILYKTNSDIYDTTEVEALVKDAVKVYNTREVTQEEIDAKVNTLSSDTYTFNEKDADYSKVNSIIDEYNNIKKEISVNNKTYTIYTDESINNVKDAIDKVDYSLKITKQNTVDTYYNNIKSAVDSLVKKTADYTDVIDALTSKINEVENTSESYTDINSALIKAKALTNTKVEDTVLYKEDIWNKFTTLLGTIKIDLTMDKMDQVVGYADSLNDIKLEKNSADYTNVVEKIEDKVYLITGVRPTYKTIKEACEDALSIENPKIEDTTLFTDKSYQEYIDTIKSIDITITIDNQATITTYSNNVEKISLEKNSADYSKIKDLLETKISEVLGKKYIYETVSEALEKANSITNPSISYKVYTYEEDNTVSEKTLEKDKYTDESFKEFKEIINNIELDRTIDQTNKTEEYEKALEEFTFDENSADYTSINNLINYLKQTDAYKNNWYTSDSIKVYNDYVNSINKDIKISSQEQVDNMYQKLKNIVRNMSLKNADYTKINSLMKKINALNKNKYTSFKGVEKAVSNIIYGKKIDEQKEVNNMYKSLNQAYQQLVLKKNNDTKTNKKDNNTSKDDNTSDDTTTNNNNTNEADEDKNQNSNILEKIIVNDDEVYFTDSTYTHKVNYDVEEANIEVLLTDINAKYKVEGPDNLEVGDNNYKIYVYKDDDTYIYNLNVYRSGNSNLDSLKIKGYNLSFNKDKKEYTLKIKDEDKLTIYASAVESTADVEILGNDNLKDGSTIKIKVTSKDNTTSTYIVHIEKDKNKSFNYIYLLIIFIIIIITTIFLKSKKKNA